ncbi:MAG: hypothetical protein AAFQ98_13435 [Bacteroidota bacterium]
MATYESVEEALRQPDDVTVLELYGDEFITNFWRYYQIFGDKLISVKLQNR